MARFQTQAPFPALRPRRLRAYPALRAMVRETHLSPADLIWPIFVMAGEDSHEPVSSMPGVSRHTVDRLPALAATAHKLGIPAICIFPYTDPALKTEDCKEAWNPDNLSNRAIRAIKDAVPDVMVMTDIALDPYNINGHDGIVRDGEIINDETVAALVKMGEAQAQSGADILGPSDMMDGRIGAIRERLEDEGHIHLGIMSYSVKYASSFYGPFRDALDSKPGFGDKKTYQMNPANSSEAMSEVDNDIDEGADIVMVKPGTPYLDMVKQVSSQFDIPVSVYQVSGEYAMIKAASEKGWLNHDSVMMESLIGFKRAGATLIATYFAKEASKLLNDE